MGSKLLEVGGSIARKEPRTRVIPNPDIYQRLRLDRERAGHVENPRRSGATTAVLRLASTPALSPVFLYYITGFGISENILSIVGL